MAAKDRSRGLVLSLEDQQNYLPQIDEHLLFSLERRYLDMLDMSQLELVENPMADSFDFRAHLRMARVGEVSYRGEANYGLHLLNMQNILAAVKDDTHSVVSMIRGSAEGTDLYYGLAKRLDGRTSVSTDHYAKILGRSIHGNFHGAKIYPLNADATNNEILNPILSQRTVCAFPGIPSQRLKDPAGPFVQGIERVMEVMRGENYILLTIAEPISLPAVDQMITNCRDLGTYIHSSVKATIAKTKGSSDTFTLGMFGMRGVSDARTEGGAWTDGTTGGEQRMGPGGVIASAGPLVGAATGAALGSVIPGIGTLIGAAVGGMLGGLGGTAAAWLSGAPMGTSAARMHSFTRSIANTAGNMMAGGGFGGYARSWTRSVSVSQEVLNKTAEHCEVLCEKYIERLKSGKNLGFWNVGVYFLTEDRYTQLRGRGPLRSAFSGDETHWEPIRCLDLNTDVIGQYLRYFSNPRMNLLAFGEERKNTQTAITIGAKLKNYAISLGKSVEGVIRDFVKGNENAKSEILENIRRQPGDFSKEQLDEAWTQIREAQLGHPLGEVMGGVSTPMNTEELAIVVNLPRQEVQGTAVRESAEFGINYSPDGGSGRQIEIGKVIHKREVMDDLSFNISSNALKKHGFICGVTGSGKTNTCMHLLQQLDVPFLVIEPAKSEYRQLLRAMPDIRVFTLGNENVSPFRLNPFDFIKGVELLAHIDHLKAVFNAAFPMYASMPYLLETAIVEVYIDKGWELATSTNRYFDIKQTHDYADYLPTLDDLAEKIKAVVDRAQYAQQLTMDLSAALRARLASLLVGSKGLMLNTKLSTPLYELLSHPTVLELKDVGDDDEKAFLMGLILSRLHEYREASLEINSDLRHVTLIEEAHRLLKHVPDHVSAEVANARGKAVETFANIVSEVREYGEGILVVDQIPAKLASEVIKNTSLKIVHKTLAQDDRDLVGATMSLNDQQNRELPLLRTGQAVVHRDDLDKPFLIQVPNTKEGLSERVTNEDVHNAMVRFHSKHVDSFFRLPGFERSPEIIAAFGRSDFRRFDSAVYAAILAMATVYIECRGEEPDVITKAAGRVFCRQLKADTSPSLAAQFIWYANHFFTKVREAYPARFNYVLAAHRAFVDAWFDMGSQDKTPESSLQAFADAMTAITDGSPYEPMVLWSVARSKASEKLAESLAEGEFERNHIRLKHFLREQTLELLLGIDLPRPVKNAIQLEFLRAIVRHNPSGAEIIRLYSQEAGV
jgi:DNA helicase HerA-like ATPase